VPGMLQQGFCQGYNLLLGWICIAPFWVTEFENTMSVLLGFVSYVCRFHCLLLVCCVNGVSYLLFLGVFLSGPTDLIGVTGSIMVQRLKYDQSFVILFLFANVAD
jgi:hypothetical protein